ncbi:MAG: aminomethyl transferase family protein [Chloroflexi bacterium]|nr:aminomethyl transferase family protein [Chloroflexota bacterium]
MLRGTPFHPRTSALCEGHNWRRWAGYITAGSYELMHEREYWAVRNSAALFDVSPLHKYLITGPDAERLVNRVVTRDVSKCAVNQVMYTPWCDARGKMIDDGTVSRLDEKTFRVTSADPSYRWFHDNAIGLKAKIDDVSDSVAALALQGPNAREILEAVSDAKLDGLKYFRLTHAQIGNVPVTITRTGYTGDLGYEIWADAQNAVPLWDTLIEGGRPYGITPAGILALDIARVEAGLILIEVDYVSAEHARIVAQTSTPFELSLGWTVSLDKGRFNGHKALREEKQRGPAWQFVGIEIDWASLEALYAEVNLPPQLPTTTVRESRPLYAEDRQVGYASSSCWSPLLKKYIALAHLESPYALPGTPVTMEVTVEHQRKQAAAKVVRTPFFEPERKRT